MTLIEKNHKVAGGKLLRCEMDISDGKISSIKITGDFFMHPEEKIVELEAALTGIKTEKDAIERVVDEFFKGEVEVIGAEADDFIALILNN